MRSASLLLLIVISTSLLLEGLCHPKSDTSDHQHAGQARLTDHKGSTRSWTITTPAPRSHTWTKLGTAPRLHPAAFKLVLRGEHFSQLEEKMTDIALSRGEWLTSSQLDYYVRPSSEAQHAVQQWLADHGVHAKDISASRADSVVAVQTDTKTVAKMFDTSLDLYHNRHGNVVVAKTRHVVVPPAIADYVASVEGVNTFATRGIRKAQKPITSAPGSPKQQSIPSAPTAPSAVHEPPPGCVYNNISWPCIRRFYGLESFQPKPKSESVAVLNYDTWTDHQVLGFESNLVPNASGYIPNKLYLGDDTGAWTKGNNTGFESTLDIETLIAVAWPLNLTTYLLSASFPDSIRALLDMPDHQRPGVVSFSYGDAEDLFPEKQSHMFCQLFQQLAAVGTTFVTASGDHGVQTSDTDQVKCPPFHADFISSCPYVLSVGATMDFAPERAAYHAERNGSHNGWSTGGFSNRFGPLDYQRSALSRYLGTLPRSLLDSGNFNASGRGFADVSAFGGHINVWTDDGFRFTGGTSASSPIWASALALLNSKCKEKGKSRVGWVHPTMYAHPEAFNDIRVGGAYDCSNTSLGFPCAPGWDPATGLGSLHFPNLAKIFGC